MTDSLRLGFTILVAAIVGMIVLKIAASLVSFLLPLAVLLGLGLVDALYQTVTTVATVGFREVRPFDTAGKIFTMVLIMLGVGAVLGPLMTWRLRHTAEAVKMAGGLR